MSIFRNNFRSLKRFLSDLWITLHSDKERLFTKYYLKNSWRSAESRSGEGSTMAHTERLRSALPEFFSEFNIKSILDAPCGDYHWFRHVSRPGISYIGADIVKPIIEHNQMAYSTPQTRFVALDITRDDFPVADLWLCRDCLFHLSYDDIFRALKNFLNSGIPYILTTTFPECLANRDVPTGSFRLINLEISPFNLGKPLYKLVDSVEGWQPRYLYLWDRGSVQAALERRYRRSNSPE